LPDKAIDLIDEAGSRVRVMNSQTPPEVKELKKQLPAVTKEKDTAVREQDFDKAGKLRDRELEIEAEIAEATINKSQVKTLPSSPKKTSPTSWLIGREYRSAS
jgi:ATPases with chaperone activity, ATP-binding subunit